MNVVHIHLPPLRERAADLEKLVEVFLQNYSGKHGRNVNAIAPEALSALTEYEFPGNVRELANTIERAVIVAAGKRIELSDLPEAIGVAAQLRKKRKKPQSLAEVEAEYVLETLAAALGNKAEAARILGISRKNLYERLSRLEKGPGTGSLDAPAGDLRMPKPFSVLLPLRALTDALAHHLDRKDERCSA